MFPILLRQAHPGTQAGKTSLHAGQVFGSTYTFSFYWMPAVYQGFFDKNGDGFKCLQVIPVMSVRGIVDHRQRSGAALKVLLTSFSS
jgi:hypothetical protein